MLERTIQTIRQSKSITRVIVSTDSPQYAEIAKKSGAEVPFIRSPELSTAKANTIDVIKDYIDRSELTNGDDICCIYATNPLLDPRLIDLGYKLLDDSKRDAYVTPVVKFGFPPQRGITINSSGYGQMLNMENIYAHSQNLPSIFHETAQFWWGNVQLWEKRVAMQAKVLPILVKEWMQQDIDTMDDWHLAEGKFDFRELHPNIWETEINQLLKQNNFFE